MNILTFQDKFKPCHSVKAFNHLSVRTYSDIENQQTFIKQYQQRRSKVQYGGNLKFPLLNRIDTVTNLKKVDFELEKTKKIIKKNLKH